MSDLGRAWLSFQEAELKMRSAYLELDWAKRKAETTHRLFKSAEQKLQEVVANEVKKEKL